jgi:hypothetical protein
MINASKEFRNLINKGVKVVNYADITLRDGTVLNLEPSDFSVGGFSMTDKTTNGKFEIGTAIAKTINVTIANHTNKFSAYDFYKSIIYMYVAVKKEDGTVLKERKGKYYVINPTAPGDTIKLSGVDSMYLFDKQYNTQKAFPATLQSILADCCTDCGVNIGFGEFDNWNFVVTNPPEECTYREVVSWVAQIAGYNARINNNDYLELVWYDTSSIDKVNIDGGNYVVYENDNIIDGGDFTTYESDLVIDGGKFTDYAPPNITKIKPPTVSTDNVVITGVKVEYNKKEALLGTDDYLINVKDNPFVKDKENEVCRYLANKLIGLSFRPLSCQMVNNPLFEPFDSCYVYDRKGNVYFTLINSVTYTISGFTTLSCNADDPVRNESSYVSESAKAVVKAKRETENQLTLYDKAVQNMNLLAANSMGLYRETEIKSDGSAIYYMSNRPITKSSTGVCSFETGSVVYKMTGDGFFVSEDGGLSYTAGFDSEGNAIVNVLSAIGITFDWAKGGTLTLGGDNNINGSMVVYDSENNIVGRFNKDGLWAENGYFKGTIESTNAYITGGQINVETDSADYDYIKIKHGTKKTGIMPSYVYVENGSEKSYMTENRIYIAGTSKYSTLTNENLFINKNSKTTMIGADGSTFYGNVSFNDEVLLKDTVIFYENVSFNKPISTSLEVLENINCSKKGVFSTGIEITGGNFTVNSIGDVVAKGDIELGSSSSDITINGETTFKSEIVLQALYSDVFKVTTAGNVTASGTLQIDGATTLKGNCSICDTTADKLSFFGGTQNSKQTVSTITTTSSATTATNATKINEIINALKKYNLL